MITPISCIKNEEGSVIVLSLLVLVVLSIVGFSASRMSNTEIQIARNNATYQQNFYLAESGATQVAQMLSNELSRTTLMNKNRPWLNDGNLVDPTIVENWIDLTAGSETGEASELTAGNRIQYTAVDLGRAAGEPLGINTPAIHNYSIMGIHNLGGRGQIIVEIGYRKRY